MHIRPAGTIVIDPVKRVVESIDGVPTTAEQRESLHWMVEEALGPDNAPSTHDSPPDL